MPGGGLSQHHQLLDEAQIGDAAQQVMMLASQNLRFVYRNSIENHDWLPVYHP